MRNGLRIWLTMFIICVTGAYQCGNIFKSSKPVSMVMLIQETQMDWRTYGLTYYKQITRHNKTLYLHVRFLPIPHAETMITTNNVFKLLHFLSNDWAWFTAQKYSNFLPFMRDIHRWHKMSAMGNACSYHFTSWICNCLSELGDRKFR